PELADLRRPHRHQYHRHAEILGRRLALRYPLLLRHAGRRGVLLFRRSICLARPVRPRAAGRAGQSPPHGGARLQCQRAPPGSLRLRVLYRRARRRAAGLELPANFARLGQRRRSAGGAAAALERRGVTGRLGARAALTGVTIPVRPAERRAVLGSNSAAKTTLFNRLTGHFPPSSGTIRFFGDDITHSPPYER